MDEKDRRALVRPAVPRGVWADLGAGGGAFTLCLAAERGPAGAVWAVDRDGGELRRLERAYTALVERGRLMAGLHVLTGDFLGGLDLPPLDGVLMANSLHYASDRGRALIRVAGMLRHGGSLLVVEYDTDSATPWVPYPIPYRSLGEALAGAGFGPPRLLAKVRSRYHGSAYSALCTRASEAFAPVSPDD